MLERHGSLVVKPARGEQGRGVAVDLDTMESVEQAIEIARGIRTRCWSKASTRARTSG
jgi:glutathione synthase/RimK-type ligase-like ATP-grasp enzyme